MFSIHRGTRFDLGSKGNRRREDAAGAGGSLAARTHLGNPHRRRGRAAGCGAGGDTRHLYRCAPWVHLHLPLAAVARAEGEQAGRAAEALVGEGRP